jgi:hypothetical protein
MPLLHQTIDSRNNHCNRIVQQLVAYSISRERVGLLSEALQAASGVRQAQVLRLMEAREGQSHPRFRPLDGLSFSASRDETACLRL